MPMSTWKVRVKPGGSGSAINIQIQADTNNSNDVRRLVEAQYGKGSVVGVPQRS